GGIQALLPQSGDGARDVRGLSRLRHLRPRDGHRGLESRQEGHLPGATALGRDRPGRAAERSAGDLEELRDRYPRRTGAALRALSLRGSPGGDLRGDAGVFYSAPDFIPPRVTGRVAERSDAGWGQYRI